MKSKKRISGIFLLLVTIIMFVCGSGFTATGEAEIYHSGKGNAEIYVVTETEESEFRNTVNAYLKQYTYIDKAELVTLDKIQKVDDGYIVHVDFRRIEKVKCVGRFEWTSLKTYTVEGSQTKWNLEYWAAQDYKITNSVYMDGQSCSVSLSSKAGGDYYCIPQKAEGTSTTVDELCRYGETAADDVRMLTFNMFLSDAVQSIKVSFPGNISYYAGDAVTLTDEDSILLTPKKMKATVTIAGEATEKEVSSVIGYVVYDRGMSPVAKVFIVIGIIAVIALMAWIFIALYQAGNRRISRIEQQKLLSVGIDIMEESNAEEIKRTAKEGGNGNENG